MKLQRNEHDLWQQVCKGNINAFNILFNNYYKSLCATAILLLKERKAAEDIVQDAFLKIWNRKHELANVANLGAYLHTTVKHACLDELRKTKPTQNIVDLELIANELDPFHKVSIKELGQQLQQAANSLPQQCKVIFEQVYVDGKKYQEVADHLGISINTVKTQLKRALSKMRSIMEKYR